MLSCNPMSELPLHSNDSNGNVDRAQIERMLALSPVERLREVEDWVNGITELRELQQRERDLGEVR